MAGKARNEAALALPKCELGKGRLLNANAIRRRLEAVTRAVLNRTLDPYSAQVIVTALKAAAEVLETSELEKRIRRIEVALEGRGGPK